MTVALFIIFLASGYVIGIGLIPTILLQRRESGATLAWLLAITFLPWLGLILFWVFGTQRLRWRRRWRARAEAAIAPALESSTRCVRKFETRAESGPLASLPEPARALALVGDKLARPSCGGNAVELLVDAEQTFSRIETTIGSAHGHVHVEYYIWRNDQTGRRLRDLLVATAKAGVEVRVLVDDVGARDVDRKFWKPLVQAGGEVARFLPVNLIARHFHLNNRNHRKIVVVDGQVAFTGGLNVGDEYFGRDPELGAWRDTHLRIEGPAVARLQEIFVEDWFHATHKDLAASRYFPDPVPAGDERVHVLASGPDDGRWHAIATMVFAAISLAREKVWLTTPYFVPEASLVAALETAALRGVDVRLLLPSRMDEPIVIHAARSFYPELLSAGVKVFEYEGGFLHAKTATVDGCWSTVGSANLDRRSFRLNFEANAVVYGPLLAKHLERVFERDLARSRRLAPADLKALPGRSRTLEGIARVLAPIL